ncbi:MAG: hypothetical protein DRP13_00705 [Candidatus Aenigmatarchaeota archaeon]|nr:MAG: hypothetical protein DRP13_00705 [Candidatus Aenigmarchaeota archaeon]
MDFPNFIDPQALYDLANSQSYNYWIGLGVQVILSTLVGGIVLLVLVEIFSHHFGESVKPANAFLVALIGNVLTFFGVMGLLISFISWVPFAHLIISLGIWIVLIKGFFGEMSFTHAVMVGVIFFVLSLVLVPYITGMIMGFVPSFNY